MFYFLFFLLKWGSGQGEVYPYIYKFNSDIFLIYIFEFRKGKIIKVGLAHY